MEGFTTRVTMGSSILLGFAMSFACIYHKQLASDSTSWVFYPREITVNDVIFQFYELDQLDPDLSSVLVSGKSVNTVI